ncbi:MAG: hypothetical protein Pars2KO_31980 [Parasphingorhabdus sp.]
MARLGGDEFAMIVAGPRALKVDQLATELVNAIRAPFLIGGENMQTTISLGLANIPDHAKNADELLKNCDLALYEAKRNGRNQGVVFHPELRKQADDRNQIKLDLSAALINGDFEVYYQPIVSLSDDQTVAFEALMRWHHPTRGLLTPDNFITYAEDNRQIVDIGEWVIREAVAEAANWDKNVKLAINLSPTQLLNSNLVNTIVHSLASSGLSPERLQLEITENVFLEESEAAIKVIENLRSLGLGFALDDFGTGFSSLNYLRQYRFDTVKIDQSFVRNIEHSDESRSIIKSVINLANDLGMKTTAEGVENETQKKFLSGLGCNQAQGYFYGVAQPIDAKSDQSRYAIR